MNIGSARTTFSTLFLTVAGTALSAPAFAQSFSGLSVPDDEIIVTATKLQADIQTLGLSVTIVDGEDLSSVDGGEDLAQRVSGLQAAVANGSQVAFQIRGIGAVDHQALTPTAAAVYVDGVYQATNVQTSPLLFDIDRAEVLKGPQGSLYGRNASSGAIHFNSVLPGAERAGYLRAELGNFDRVNLTAAATLPVSPAVSFRLSGRYLTQDAALDNVVTNPAIAAPKDAGGVRDEFGLRAIAQLEASPRTTVTLNAHYAEDNGINPAPRNSSLSVGRHEISIGPDGVQDTDNEFYGASVLIDHDFGALTLVSQTAFTGYNQQYGFDFDGTPAPFGVPSLNANLAYDRDFSQISQELRLSHETARGDFMAGLYWAAEDFVQDYLIWCGVLNPDTLLGTCRYVGAPGRAGPNPASDGTATSLLSEIEQTRQTAALFTYNTVQIAPKWSLVLGGRLTDERIKGSGAGRHYFDDGVIALNNRDGLGAAIGSNKITDTALSGNLGLNYAPTQESLLYLAYARGYKSGGFNGEVINNATHFADEGLFASETVDALEAGFKLAQDGVRFNLASFYQFYDRPQARIFVPFSAGDGSSFTSNSLSNLDAATAWGVEGEVQFSPLSGLDLSLGATWLNTQINQDEDPRVPQNADVFDGNALPFASEFSATLTAHYERALTPSLRASIEANGQYQSGFFLDAEGRDDRRQNGYETLDARAALHLANGVEFGLWGRNLTRSDFAVSGFGFIGYNTFRSAPRGYGVFVGYRY